MEDDINDLRFLVAELPDQIGVQVFSMFMAGWPIRARMRTIESRTCLEVRACAPVGGVDDARVTLVHDGSWSVVEEATGLVSQAGTRSVRDCVPVVEHMYRYVPAWLVPELSSEARTGFVDLHERLGDEHDPVLENLAGRFEAVFETMVCALVAGWDFIVDLGCHEDSATIEMSTQIPGDIDDDFRLLVGDALDVNVRDMQMHWTFRDNSWQLDPAQTGFASADAAVDVVGLDTLCDVMEFAAANCAFDPPGSSKQWHSGGATTPRSALPAIPLAPEASPDPEVIATRARRIDEWATENGFCAPLPPTKAALTRHLDHAGPGRAGHYILEFTDGQCYIGESIDLPERLGQHRGRYRDIHRIRVRLDATATRSLHGKRHLRLHEKSLIHSAQDAGLLARNINEMATMIGTSRHLDELISADEQHLWLDAPDIVNSTDTAARPDFPAERLARTAANYRHFRTRSDADQITRIIGRYLSR